MLRYTSFSSLKSAARRALLHPRNRRNFCPKSQFGCKYRHISETLQTFSIIFFKKPQILAFLHALELIFNVLGA